MRTETIVAIVIITALIIAGEYRKGKQPTKNLDELFVRWNEDLEKHDAKTMLEVQSQFFYPNLSISRYDYIRIYFTENELILVGIEAFFESTVSFKNIISYSFFIDQDTTPFLFLWKKGTKHLFYLSYIDNNNNEIKLCFSTDVQAESYEGLNSFIQIHKITPKAFLKQQEKNYPALQQLTTDEIPKEIIDSL